MDLSKNGVMLNSKNTGIDNVNDDPWKDWDWISLEHEDTMKIKDLLKEADLDSDSDSEEYNDANSDSEEDETLYNSNNEQAIINLKDPSLYDSESDDSTEDVYEWSTTSRETIDLTEEEAVELREHYSPLMTRDLAPPPVFYDD